MKKYLLLLAILPMAFTSCSTDETLTTDNPGNQHSALRAGYWNGVIAIENPNGSFQFNVNPQLLKADLEEQLRIQGDTTTLETIAVVGKNATNDGTNGYMLISSDNRGLSIGVMLAKSASNELKLDFRLEDPDPSTISCRGCATGCNLEYLNMPGGKVPYCNSNGCGEFCQTKHTSFL